MVERIREGGLRAGIWIAPFLVGSQSRVAAEHPDWLVRDSDDRPVQALRNWGQDTHPLDVTHPDVQEHLATVFGWFTGIGIDLFKIDFVYAAALAGQRYDGHLRTSRPTVKVLTRSAQPSVPTPTCSGVAPRCFPRSGRWTACVSARTPHRSGRPSTTT